MNVGEVLAAAAAAAAVLSVGAAAVRTLTGRRVKLDVEVGFAIGPPQTAGGQNSRLATVTVRNKGRRSVVLTDLGIARCEKQPLRAPVSRKARATLFRPGDRLERDDVRQATFDLALLTPDHNGEDLPLWGYATVTAQPNKMHLTRKPLQVRDARAGSPTAGDLIYP